ncbi:hypothetical protein SAMN05421866_4179 [Chryseobacterium oranimense]|uniref:Bacteriophage CI repressor helix-turn-helix domain-containing protein n=1 Tax=Chryseobacterium oranimense TaxID=421058 RepID=A0A1M5WQ09_9FLAO|nr:hypothetical protein [Chryseobacterium oranimense]SHH89676.1 hypothetical protein SAMN05421866_4179 [Chryseobacterium oranimense]
MTEELEITNNEQSSVKERLLKFIEFKRINPRQFEELAGLSTSYISNMRKSIKPSTFDSKIAPVFPELNKLWLLHGEGNMINSSQNEKENDLHSDQGLHLIRNKPHDEQMEMLYNKIDKLESTIEILKERDQLYFKAIIAHLGITSNDENEVEKSKKSSTS